MINIENKRNLKIHHLFFVFIIIILLHELLRINLFDNNCSQELIYRLLHGKTRYYLTYFEYKLKLNLLETHFQMLRYFVIEKQFVLTLFFAHLIPYSKHIISIFKQK